MKLYYDFHIHSCLSPCGDMDMTPNNIVNMAIIKGLDIIAVTDHNTCGNCRAAMEVGERNGLIVIPGMELNTREDVHVLCLFNDIEKAEEFSCYIYNNMQDIINKKEVFGEQIYMNSQDEAVGIEEKLLITASNIGIYETISLCREYNGIVIPAHIDKSSYSILSVLGFITEDMNFSVYELSPRAVEDDILREQKLLKDKLLIRNSDAHYLWDIGEREHFIEVSSSSIKKVLEYISGIDD